MGAIEESELIGFDTATGRVHLFSANKYAIRDHLGDWTRDDQLTVRCQASDGDSEVTEEITIDFEEPDRIVAGMIESNDGVVAITTELTLFRQG